MFLSVAAAAAGQYLDYSTICSTVSWLQYKLQDSILITVLITGQYFDYSTYYKTVTWLQCLF